MGLHRLSWGISGVSLGPPWLSLRLVWALLGIPSGFLMPSGASRGLLGASWDFLGPFEAFRGLPFSWGLLGFPGHPSRIPEPLRRLREDPGGPRRLLAFMRAPGACRDLVVLLGSATGCCGDSWGLLGLPGLPQGIPSAPGASMGFPIGIRGFFIVAFRRSRKVPEGFQGFARSQEVPRRPRDAPNHLCSLILRVSPARRALIYCRLSS